MKFNSVHEVVRPILWVSLAGIACTVRYKDSIISSSIVLTRFVSLMMMISMVHLFLLPRSMRYIESDLLQSTTEFEVSLHFITKVINQSMAAICGVAIRIIIVYNMGRYFPSIIANVKSMDDLLKYDKHARDGLLLMIVSILLPIFCIPFQLYTILYTDNAPTIIVLGINIYNLFSTCCCELQFIALCYLLGRRMKSVNQVVEGIIDIKVKNINASKIISIHNTNIKQDIVLEQLHMINEVEDLLNKICESIQAIYNPILLITVCALFFNALFNYYYTIFGGFNTSSEGNSVRAIGQIVNDAVWSVYYTIRFVAICISADMLCGEKSRMKVLLCSALDTSWSEDVKTELRILLARCNFFDFGFSACGFFDVKTSLITSAVGAGATYLVILAQFHKT